MLAVGVAAVLLAAAPAAGAPLGTIELQLGKGSFWDGVTIGSGSVADSAECDTRTPCPVYSVAVPAAAARLRVAIDTPMRDDSFRIELVDPAGALAATATNSNQFNAEAFVDSPAVGTWSVRVVPASVSRASFRLRAKLERRLPSLPRGRQPLLPNLKSVPPYEFGFIAPANPLNGLYPPDTVNPPLEVAGLHPLSCSADEMAPVAVGGAEARRCLRLTSGPINAGRGPFEMRFRFMDDVGAGRATIDGGYIRGGTIQQRIHYGDGTSVEVPAGTYSFHNTHGHFHDDNILTYQLYRVVADGVLAEAGDGTKSGFCPANQLFGDWHRFYQAAPDAVIGSGDSGTGNCQGFSDGVLGLSPGWGDVYRWQRPGQYVEFGDNGDGLYVVRTTVDIHNAIRESREDDNSAYALIRVVGERIDLIERGQGLHPWDRRKVVFRGAGPASRD